MGRGWNEMMPQPNNRTAITTTRKRLLSAKSTRPRIIVRSLLLGVLEDQGVLHHALPRLNARPNLLHVAGEHVSAGYFHAPELPVAGGNVDPVAVMKVQDRGSRNHGMHLTALAEIGRASCRERV